MVDLSDVGADRLLPTGTGTDLGHGFRHGPAGSGLRAMVEQDPENASAIMAEG